MSIIFFLCTSWYDIGKLASEYKKNLDASEKFATTILVFGLLKSTLLRVLILSIIVFILKFCIRNYNALKHNQAVNIHKANSFNAAHRLITSLPEDRSREQLVNEAAKEIFAQHKTGYLSKEDVDTNLTTLEKLAGIVKNTKS